MMALTAPADDGAGAGVSVAGGVVVPALCLRSFPDPTAANYWTIALHTSHPYPALSLVKRRTSDGEAGYTECVSSQVNSEPGTRLVVQPDTTKP